MFCYFTYFSLFFQWNHSMLCWPRRRHNIRGFCSAPTERRNGCMKSMKNSEQWRKNKTKTRKDDEKKSLKWGWKIIIIIPKNQKNSAKKHNLKYELAFMMTRRSMHRQRTKKGKKENLKYFPNIYSSYPTIFRISLWQYRLWIFSFGN